ncbi:MAG: hypothetical protein L3J13_00960 [Devosiaceae bacterium]|nr:hypothetical protein [Devosiaceae bacterium]
MRTIIGLALFLSLSGFASAYEKPTGAPLCVNNQSGVSLFFVIELGADLRVTRTLEHGKNLCLAGQGKLQNGTVAVFQDQFAIEGCTRLANSGQVFALQRYASFDNCTWQ